MEPVEINAGAWYLRALRADDRPALAGLGESNLVDDSLTDWADDTGYSWAVCEPATGELLAEVVLDPRTAAVTTRARPGHEEAAAVAADAVRRFAEAFSTG